MTALSMPENIVQEQEHASLRELAARDVARLIKERIAAETEWGDDSEQAMIARPKSDKKLLEVDYVVASEGAARAYDLKPHSLDEAAAEAANGDTKQQGQ
jgi:hypothetical protein